MNYGIGIGSFADGFMSGRDMRQRNQQREADEAMRARMGELLSGNAQASTPKPAFTGSSSIDPAQQVAQVQANEAQSVTRQMPAFTGSDSMSRSTSDSGLKPSDTGGSWSFLSSLYNTGGQAVNQIGSGIGNALVGAGKAIGGTFK